MAASALPLLMLLGGGLVLASGGKKKTSRLSDAERAKRVVRESREILQGQRDAYTDDDPDAAEPEALQPDDVKASGKLSAAERAALVKPKAKAKPKVRPPADGVEAEALQAAIAAEQVSAKDAGRASPANPVPVAVTPSASATGYDPVAAKATAQRTADHLRTRKSKYDRAVLALFQRRAAIADDGLYGPLSASALRSYGAKNVPAPFFKGALKTYVPPEER
jgi:hypothetical protein